MDTRKLTAVIFSMAVTAAAADGALEGCRDIRDDGARLACYDAASARAAPPPAAAPALAPPTPPPAAPQPTPEDLFGRDAVTSEAMVREAAGIERPESLDGVIARVTTTAYGKRVVTLGNGQVWTQTDSVALKLEPGDTVTIRRAALGSYLLGPRGGGHSMRVTRNR